MTPLAPIVLFVYNRLAHTKKTVDALRANHLAGDSDLYIYSDAARMESDTEKVALVREYLDSVDGFRKVVVVKREFNLGLAKNIIDGVSEACNTYGRVIVLEDDLVTSPFFLTFMNNCLREYENQEKIMHVSGWTYPDLSRPKTGDEVFLTTVMNCWGWGTWKRSWDHFSKNVDQLLRDFSYQDIVKFNLNEAHDFWIQVLANKRKKMNTWAIFWYATIFRMSALCLNPVQSLVHNIGHDNSGMHSKKSDSYETIAASFCPSPELTEHVPDQVKQGEIEAFYKKIRDKSLAARLRTLKSVSLRVYYSVVYRLLSLS